MFDIKSDKTIYDMSEKERAAGTGFGWPSFVVAIFLVIGISWLYMYETGVGMYYYVSPEHWAVEEMTDGNTILTMKAGNYRKKWGSDIYLYPRFYDVHLTDKDGMDRAIPCMFSDGVKARIGAYLLLKLIDEDEEKTYALHRRLMGKLSKLDDNVGKILETAISKASGIMSAEEHMSSGRVAFMDYIDACLDGTLANALAIHRTILDVNYEEEFKIEIRKKRMAKLLEWTETEEIKLLEKKSVKQRHIFKIEKEQFEMTTYLEMMVIEAEKDKAIFEEKCKKEILDAVDLPPAEKEKLVAEINANRIKAIKELDARAIAKRETAEKRWEKKKAEMEKELKVLEDKIKEIKQGGKDPRTDKEKPLKKEVTVLTPEQFEKRQAELKVVAEAEAINIKAKAIRKENDNGTTSISVEYRE